MLQRAQPADYVIATGQTHTLQEFVATAFDILGLDWQDHVEQAEEFIRPTDISISRADPSRAARDLGWTAHSMMEDVVRKMMFADDDFPA